MFYNQDSYVGEYVNYLLKEIKKVVPKIVIVSNGKLSEMAKQCLCKYTSEIYERVNYGFDGGAYKEIFTEKISKTDLDGFDELIMMNDSFFGPLYGWQEIFEEMSGVNVDFWGLSEWREGFSSLFNKVLPNHVQSYFLVIRKRILELNDFYEFWNVMNLPRNYNETILLFEIAFSEFLIKRGYRYTSYLRERGISIEDFAGRAVYNQKPYELIRKYNFPIVKRKALGIHNFIESKMVLDYIRKECNYPIDNIVTWYIEYDKMNGLKPFSAIVLEEFYMEHKKVYIWGNGKIGINIKKYFEYKNWRVAGIIVSGHNEMGTLSADEVQLEKSDGIVFALGKRNCLEVKEKINKQWGSGQLLFPIY